MRADDGPPTVAPAPVLPVERPARRFTRLPFQRTPRRADVRDIREGKRTQPVLERDSRVRRFVGAADLVAAAVAIGGAFAVGGATPEPAALLAPPVAVLFSKLARLYDRDEHVIHKTTLDEAPVLLQVATLYALITWFAGSVFAHPGFGRAEVATTWALCLLGMLALRVIARWAATNTTPPERLLVLGDAESAARLGARIESAHSPHAVLVGRVALSPGDHQEPAPLGPPDDLDFLLRAHAVERVVIVPTDDTSARMLDTIRLVKALGVKVSVLPRLFEVVGSAMEFDDVDGITLLGLRRYGLTRTSWYIKRTLDVAGATIALVALSPLLAAIAATIKLTSPGPVLFRQTRVGRRGAPFQMLKFRTMCDGADEMKATLESLTEADGLFKIAEDPRVTRVGRILRRTSIDEVPQLVNVLRGEMSLVGPRPLVEEEDRKIAGWHHRRREGTPGMTGVWQVLGPKRVPLDDMVKMDYLYRANWSLWLDVKIMLRTAAHVLSRRGA